MGQIQGHLRGKDSKFELNVDRLIVAIFAVLRQRPVGIIRGLLGEARALLTLDERDHRLQRPCENLKRIGTSRRVNGSGAAKVSMGRFSSTATAGIFECSEALFARQLPLSVI